MNWKPIRRLTGRWSFALRGELTIWSRRSNLAIGYTDPRLTSIRAPLEKAARSADSFRVILVSLRGVRAGECDVFLKQVTSVNFRSGLNDPSTFRRLVAGIDKEAIEPGEPVPCRGVWRNSRPSKKAIFFGRTSQLVTRLVNSRFIANHFLLRKR